MLTSLISSITKINLKYAIIALIIIGAYTWHVFEVNTEVSKAEQAIIAEYTEKYNQAISDVNESNMALLQNALNKVADKQNEINSIASDRDRLIDELRQRKSRQTITNTNSAESGSACTGAELSREDASFLTREAARADQSLRERDYYFNLYESARIELEQLSKNITK